MRLITVLICVLLFASSCYIEPQVVEEANKACENNGGVERYYFSTDNYVTCKNGAIFTFE